MGWIRWGETGVRNTESKERDMSALFDKWFSSSKRIFSFFSFFFWIQRMIATIATPEWESSDPQTDNGRRRKEKSMNRETGEYRLLGSEQRISFFLPLLILSIFIQCIFSSFACFRLESRTHTASSHHHPILFSLQTTPLFCAVKSAGTGKKETRVQGCGTTVRFPNSLVQERGKRVMLWDDQCCVNIEAQYFVRTKREQWCSDAGAAKRQREQMMKITERKRRKMCVYSVCYVCCVLWTRKPSAGWDARIESFKSHLILMAAGFLIPFPCRFSLCFANFHYSSSSSLRSAISFHPLSFSHLLLCVCLPVF